MNRLKVATQKRTRKRRAGVLAAIAVPVVCAIAVCRSVSASTRAWIYRPADVPRRPVAIVFGARVRAGGILSPVLSDRVRTAVELYHSGKVRKLLMTGDNSRKDYDEPTAMQQFAIRHGVPADDIVLDYAGFRTYDSCYRAKEVFGVSSAVLVTQVYHLPRSLYTARSMGMDAVGCIADRHHYGMQRWMTFREQWAILLAWLQVNVTRPKPHFLGPRLVCWRRPAEGRITSR